MGAIENFLSRYDKAFKSNSKEIRLQIQEAKELAHELSLISIRTSELSEHVIHLQSKLIKALEKIPTSEDSEIVMDGGGFK